MVSRYGPRLFPSPCFKRTSLEPLHVPTSCELIIQPTADNFLRPDQLLSSSCPLRHGLRHQPLHSQRRGRSFLRRRRSSSIHHTGRRWSNDHRTFLRTYALSYELWRCTFGAGIGLLLTTRRVPQMVLPTEGRDRVSVYLVWGWMAALSSPMVEATDMTAAQRTLLLTIACAYSAFLDLQPGVRAQDFEEMTRRLRDLAHKLQPLTPAESELQTLKQWLEARLPAVRP